MLKELLNLRLRRARACFSPVGTTASKEVLSLNGCEHPEETTLAYMKQLRKSNNPVACNSMNCRLTDSLKHICRHTIIAILPAPIRATADTDQVEALQRDGVDEVTLSPACGAKACGFYDFFRQCYFNMVGFNGLWSCRAQRDHGAQPNISSWLGRNNDNRSALNNLRHNKALVITQQNLARVRRFLNRHNTLINTQQIKEGHHVKKA